MTFLKEWFEAKIKDGDINQFDYKEFSEIEKIGAGTVNRANWDNRGIKEFHQDDIDESIKEVIK